jgi:hypothetical protein
MGSEPMVLAEPRLQRGLNFSFKDQLDIKKNGLSQVCDAKNYYFKIEGLVVLKQAINLVFFRL